MKLDRRTTFVFRIGDRWFWDCNRGCLQNSYPIDTWAQALADAFRHVSRWHPF